MKVSDKTLYILAVLALVRLSIAASTAVNLSDPNRVSGIAPTTIGGTGVATAAANTVFAGPTFGAAAAPSFKAFATVMGAIPTNRRFAFIGATGSATGGFQDISTTAGTVTQNVSSSGSPPNTQFATNTTDANVASESGNLNNVVGKNLFYEGVIKLSSTATRRTWIGFTDQTAATMGASDNPAGNYAALRHSTAAADTNFQCITKDATTQTVTDSGVAATTNIQKITIIETAGVSFTFLINDAVACTNVTHLPTTATPLRYFQSVTCVVCTPTAQNFQRAQVVMLEDIP